MKEALTASCQCGRGSTHHDLFAARPTALVSWIQDWERIEFKVGTHGPHQQASGARESIGSSIMIRAMARLCFFGECTMCTYSHYLPMLVEWKPGRALWQREQHDRDALWYRTAVQYTVHRNTIETRKKHRGSGSEVAPTCCAVSPTSPNRPTCRNCGGCAYCVPTRRHESM